MNILQHDMIDKTKGALKLAPWGGNALQTINITRNTPRTPNQAVGYRGVVDFSSGQVTTDLALDCILTEQTDTAAAGTSVYLHGAKVLTLADDVYYLTSCSVGFQAGSAATVKYGYITAGFGSGLIALSAAPTPLLDGEEAAFAVVMGSDGRGLEIVNKDQAIANGIVLEADSILPSGVQSMSYSATINKDHILDVRSSNAIQFLTTYPIDSTVNMEVFADEASVVTVRALKSVGVRLGQGADFLRESSPGVDYITVMTAGAKGKVLVMATGLAKTQEGESVSVGGKLTHTFNFSAADLWLPLSV